ncbi:hypothetical protein [Flavobacterium davisii]|uniref:hypothetical protein n=1 Tax=Flavobacterium davisii TaxID=2906077 RepID=UPI0035CEDEDC
MAQNRVVEGRKVVQCYLSQDPIGLQGGNPTLYGYVFDNNTEVDPFGLDCKLRDSKGKFRKALTAAEELNVLGGLNGKSRRKIENRLKKRGYTSVPARSGGNVWTKPMADGNTVVVRVDPAMSRTPARGFADEVPHAHKEVVSTSDISAGDYGRGASVTKYDDLNNVSTNPRDIHIPITW